MIKCLGGGGIGGRFLHTFSGRRNYGGQFPRRVKGHNPPAGVGEKNPEDGRLTVVAENAASVFNIAMGEVMMTKGRKGIAVEGSRMVEEAVKSKLKLQKLFILKGLKREGTVEQLLKLYNDKLNEGNKSQPEVYQISAKLMQTWSSVTTPPGIIGIFQKPKPGEINSESLGSTGRIPLTVVCDNIREPGNLGSILRSAAGSGCKAALLTRGCVDPWNMKVLRGASGAHFCIPVIENVGADQLQSQILDLCDPHVQAGCKRKVAILLADSNDHDPRINLSPVAYTELNCAQFDHCFLVIGGETEGLGNDTINIAKRFVDSKLSNVTLYRVKIPLAYGMDSLNAANAFGIIAFEIFRQFNINKIP